MVEFAGWRMPVQYRGVIDEHRAVRTAAGLFDVSHMGEVRVAGPPTMMPAGIEALGVKPCYSMDDALAGADVIVMLRIQQERLDGALFPSVREYSRTFGLTGRTLALAKPDAIVLHPGPINRGVEIASEVADAEPSRILDQVTNGVAVRMAVLYLLTGGAA